MDEASARIDVDKLQLKLFSNCRFQIFAFLCLGVIYARGAWNVFGVLFLAGEASHICNSSGIIRMIDSYSEQVDTIDINVTAYGAHWDNNGTEKKVHFRECDVLISHRNGTNFTEPCSFGWVYKNRIESTIVSEWDLICIRAYLAELSTTLYMVGSMLGALLITPLADKIGRRLVLLVSLLAQAAVGVCVALSSNYMMFTIFRFIVGFFNMGIALSTYVMMTEIFPAQYRTIPCCGFQIFWAIGIILTSLFGFLIQDWRHLQLIFSLPNLICAVFVWFLPESLPWLVLQNKINEAHSVVKRIASFNKIDPPSDFCASETLPLNKDNGEGNSNFTTYNIGEQPLLSGLLSHQDAVLLLSESSSPQEFQLVDAHNGSDRIEQNHQNCDLHGQTFHLEGSFNNLDKAVHVTKSDSVQCAFTSIPDDRGHSFHNLKNVLVLCHSSRIWLYSVIISYLFFVNSLSYFGISLSTPVLHGNQYLNLFLLGAVEIPAYIINVFVCNRFGRKITLFVFMLMCGIMNIAAFLVPETATLGINGMRIAFVILGKFAITGSYTTVYLYSAEIFPTSMRNCAIGISSFFENLGSIAAPFIVFSAKSYHELPLILFGVVSIIGGAMMTVMPETHNCPLPQTVEEVESWDMCKCERA